MTIEERTGDFNADIDIHDTEMVYPDDHEVNSQKELDHDTEIDRELNADREFTQPEHDQQEDQEDQDGELVPTEQETQNDVDSGSATTKRCVPRGRTQMKKTWERTELERIVIVVNEFGQPVNKKSCELTHFMGVLARSGKECPLYKRWHKVRKSTKRDLLATIKSKFDIRGDADKWILQSIGKKVKSWRNRLKKLHYDQSKSRREQLRARPKVVQKKHWKRLVDLWNCDASKKMSDENKRNRQKRSLHPLIGKKSYAQIREELKIQLGREPSRVDIFERSFSKADITNNFEAVRQLEQMKELAKELLEGSLDEPGPDDIYAQVRGTAKHGQAEMYGLGVRVSDVWGEVRSRAAICQENVKLRAELQEYKEREKQKNVGKEVHLKSINNPTLIVAKGRLRSLDPLTVVGGVEIGTGWAEVHVQVAIKSDETVIRPFELVTTMIEATGVAIAWPTSLLSVVPLD
ncbi:uncharacterized protein [Rutidosis leptorrhynchoides]|uniref:uncharacterized protein n=1 Tax=Rutidosis leptorrhynchoides TaxID=125765 RepID=UPI003A9989E8